LPQELVIPLRGEHQITLLELATHTSGLPRVPDNLLRLLEEDENLTQNPYAQYDLKRLAEGLAEIKLKAVDRPGVDYSNLGMGLLGDALANHAGTTYRELLRTRILEPAGMKQSLVSPPSEAQRETMATGHNHNGEPVSCWSMATLQGAGAICSTPSDMLRFLEAQCGRTETQLSKAIQVTQEKRNTVFLFENIGLGWFMKKTGGRQIWWHNGGTGGYTSFVSFCRDPAVAVVVLSNSGYDGSGVVDILGNKLIQRLVKAGKKTDK